MASTLRKRWNRAKALKPDELYDRPVGQRILMSSTAGFANQVRSALAIAAAGLVPVVQTNAEYRASVELEEGIDLGALFEAFEHEGPSHFSARVYRHWIIAPWRDLNPADAAQVYNALNFMGLINASRLPYLPEMRIKLREYYDAFNPCVTRAEVSSRVDSDIVAVHLRMFGRNYSSVYEPPGKGVISGRHTVRETWSKPRLQSAVAAIKALTPLGSPVAVYTDRRDYPDTVRFVEMTQTAGFKPYFADVQHNGSLRAMEECTMLSCHKRLVLTSGSSFGHLGALLAPQLETVLSV